MFGSIAATLLSLALTAPVIDVPYLPQSDLLCGGAAAAMVFRYWGYAHATEQPFASLVDRHAGGIAATALVAAISRRGWTVEPFAGSLDELDGHLASREPIIVLLADRGARFHYVVVVGRTEDAVIVHDPSWGPSRHIHTRDFVGLWRPSNFWSLIIRPGGAWLPSGITVGTAVVEPPDPAALATAEKDASTAELAGIRFGQRRWRDAADLARQALARDATDAYALDVLGSSLFMLNDPGGALRAWNRIGKPKLDRVRIDGVHHARYQAIADALRLTPGALLTAETFERARRRLDELPDRATARLDLRPDADGFATVDVVIAERAMLPHDVASWSSVALDAAVDREVVATLPGFSGQGEIWTAGGRFWSNRPRVDAGFVAPHFAGLPGVWRVDASWEAETYALANSSSLLRESRTHAGVSVSDWFSAHWRYTLSTGVDDWSGDRRAASVGAAIERRLLKDRMSISAQGETWITHGPVPGFNAMTLRSGWSSSPVVSGWSYAIAGGWQRVSDHAPLALWPGAGDGHGRSDLLRAHPLLDDGVINVTSETMFGRSLMFGNAEGQRWFDRPLPVRLGAAAFVDMAQASRPIDGVTPPMQIDVGAGVRVRIPGVKRILRVDVARGLHDGATALTVGWLF
ncbi:MAG TPA: papain-like cysteine protease family protein [Vicinamibacterales bacterium]|nr:papain-like cysteine protease family protein [Vicinamibacterales bacterium]